MREQVKHLSKKVGVYCIINKVNSKMYVGSSRDISKRVKGHERELRRNNHRNRYLQSAYNKYGESSFEVKVLKLCSEKNLIKQEQIFMNKYQTTTPGCGYNLAIRADGKRLSEEQRKYLSEVKKGKKMSAEAKLKMSKAQKGRKHSEETKKKISRANKGHKPTEFALQKAQEWRKDPVRSKKIKQIIGEKSRKTWEKRRKDPELMKQYMSNMLEKQKEAFELKKMKGEKINKGWKGRKHSEETKKKISEANKGQKPTEFCLEKGKEWRKDSVRVEKAKRIIGEKSKKMWEKLKQNPALMKQHIHNMLEGKRKAKEKRELKLKERGGSI